MTNEKDLEASIEAFLKAGHASNCDGDEMATLMRVLAAEMLKYSFVPSESRHPSAYAPELVSPPEPVRSPKPKKRRR